MMTITHARTKYYNIFHGNEKDCAPFSRPCLELVQKQKNRQINYLMQELSCIRTTLHKNYIIFFIPHWILEFMEVIFWWDICLYDIFRTETIIEMRKPDKGCCTTKAVEGDHFIFWFGLFLFQWFTNANNVMKQNQINWYFIYD